METARESAPQTETYLEALTGLLHYLGHDQLLMTAAGTAAHIAHRADPECSAEDCDNALEAMAAYLLGEPARLQELTGWTLADIAPANISVGTVRARIARRLAWARGLAGLT
jgi:hypothetical protein